MVIAQVMFLRVAEKVWRAAAWRDRNAGVIKT